MSSRMERKWNHVFERVTIVLQRTVNIALSGTQWKLVFSVTIPIEASLNGQLYCLRY